MKRTLMITIIFLITESMYAQNGTRMIRKYESKYKLGIQKIDKRSAMRSGRTSPLLRIFNKGIVRPEISIELTEGTGIHLVNFPRIGPIPSMAVGMDFKAGIKIII